MASASSTLKAGNIVASGTITSGGNLVVATPTCTSGQVPSWSGSAWTCGTGGGGGISGLTTGTMPVAASGSTLADSPLSVVGGILHLNPNQNVINIDGILWSNGDSRTSGNLEAGSDLGDPVAGTDCNGTGCAALSSRVRFSNTNHQVLYSIATAEADEGSGSSATNTNIEIDGSGPGGAVIVNGTGTGSNAGGGGLFVKKGQNSSSTAWGADASGNTTQAGNIVASGGATLGGSLTINSGFADINGSLFASADSVFMESKGYNCDYADNSTQTCTINNLGFGEGQTQFRNLSIRDGKGADVIDVTASTKGVEFKGAITLDATTTIAAHFNFSSTAQTATNISACGGGTPAITATSTDSGGTITEGTTATGCTLGFVTTWTVAPFCVCSATTGVAVGCSATATALTIVNTSASGDVINYVCFGARGSS